MKESKSPSEEHFSDGDNLILQDNQSGTILYGHEILHQTVRRQKTVKILLVQVPAEAYIALLQNYFAEVPEVRTYLAEAKRLNQINPGEGKLLETVSNAIWLDKRHLDILLTARPR